MMESFDVLVIGSGIAGLCAAVEAARAGAKVALASAGKIMSGSSFFPGTWGLGLVGPVDKADEQDLIDTIIEVGGGVADPGLADTFVRGIPDAIEWLENDLGVTFKRPESEESAHQKQFIPCFDHKTRVWRGLTRRPLEAAFKHEIERLGIITLPYFEILDLIETSDERIGGGVFYARDCQEIVPILAKVTVIATGGTGGLFERSLTSSDVTSSAQGIAARHGAELINLEFMQMMPGLISPKRNLVFNEKTWRYVRFDNLPNAEAEQLSPLLEQRSGYGPFTSRLPSRAIDLAIDQAGSTGLAVHYDFPRQDVPEFVQTFTSWLSQEHGIEPSAHMRIAMYAHASNGGIKIDTHAQTNLKGLFACGEATGGMHGADRIGGLSSANGVVFGRIAGRNAAAHAKEIKATGMDPTKMLPKIGITDSEARELTHSLKRIMSTYAMIDRTDEGLTKALEGIESIMDRAGRSSAWDAQPNEIANLARLNGQTATAKYMLQAMKARKNSLGSHYRADEIE